MRIKELVISISCAVLLTGCGLVAYQKRMEDYILRTPGALDPSLSFIYDTYTFKFLDRYQITHQFPRDSRGCAGYSTNPRLDREPSIPGKGAYCVVRSIFEKDGHAWQEFEGDLNDPILFDNRVRSVKIISATDGKEIEAGLLSVCHQKWVGSSHYISVWLHKWTLQDWMERRLKKDSGEFHISTKKVGSNVWTVKESKLQVAIPGTMAPFQTWVLPIENTGYTLAFRLGANLNSLKYPQAHARIQTMFQHLIETVKIEPLSR